MIDAELITRSILLVVRVSWPQCAVSDGGQEHLQRPHLDPVVGPQPALAQIHEDAARQAREIGDSPQPRELRRGKAGLGLHFEREIVAAAPQQEVDLRPASLRRRPVRNLLEKAYPTSLA